MKNSIYFLPLLLLSVLSNAQYAGNYEYDNSSYSNSGYYNKYGDVYSPGTNDSRYLSDSSFLVSVSVLSNIKPNSYTITWSLYETAGDAATCIEKIDKRIDNFITKANTVGIGEHFIDIVAMLPTYENVIEGKSMYEKLTGYQVMKNIIIKCDDDAKIQELMLQAATEGIYDLVEVKYSLDDVEEIKKQLYAEAEQLLIDKKAYYSSMATFQVKREELYLDEFRIYEPQDLYESYVAEQTLNRTYGKYSKYYAVETPKTFFYKGVDISAFDKVTGNTDVIPDIQVTLRLQVVLYLKKS